MLQMKQMILLKLLLLLFSAPASEAAVTAAFAVEAAAPTSVAKVAAPASAIDTAAPALSAAAFVVVAAFAFYSVGHPSG